MTIGRDFSDQQRQWLERIRSHLAENLSINREDFETMPVFAREGGWTPANRAFQGKLEKLLSGMNEAIAQ
jgi:type I restriction enzyme R subunit